MKNAGRVIFFIIAILCLGSGLLYAYLEEIDTQSQVIKGEVVGVELLKSEITIKFKQKNGDNDEIILAINEATKVRKDTVEISFTEIFKDDKVTVEYYVDSKSFGPPIAREINVVSIPQ